MTSRPERPEVVVRGLTPTDDRSGFRSGNVELDRFFQRHAGQNQFRHHVGTSWVALVDERIVGFVAVSAAQLEVGLLPEKTRKRLPAYPLPVLRLARLAVAAEVQGLGVGRVLLRSVFALAWRMADDLGCVGIVVDTKEPSQDFYAALGFQALEHRRGGLGDRPEPTPMFFELAAAPQPTTSPWLRLRGP